MLRLGSKSSGLTLVETMISSVIITIMILGSVQLMGRIYRYITSATLKTQSLNIASETVDLLRLNGFSGLKVTPDSMLPEPLSNLNQSGNPQPIEYVEVKTNTFTVYKIIQWAKEDENGMIQAQKISDMGAYDNFDLKQIKVIVTYYSDNMTKRTELTGLIANREVPIAGSVVTGRIYKKKTGGPSEPPGQASFATVYVVGHPEYTSRQYDDSGNYRMSNVMPGSYMLYASGLGFQTTYYTGNPLVVTDTVQTITGIDFLCPAVDVGAVTGNVYILSTQIVVPTSTVGATSTTAPTPSGPTPTPVCASVSLSATGSMSGKISTYGNPTAISTQDTMSATTNRTARVLYSELADMVLPPGNVITNVTLNILQNSTNSNANTYYNLSFTNDSGTNWWNTGGTWSTTVQVFASPTMTSNGSLTNIYVNITPLYSSWDQAKINSLGLLIESKGTNSNPADFTLNSIDHAYLLVTYCIPSGGGSPTAVPTSGSPTSTPTPVYQCITGAIVRALDGLSIPDTSACSYRIDNIDATSNTVTITATYSKDGVAYYKQLTGVPIVADTTTFLNIYLDVSTGTSIVNGNVFDAVARTIPLVGANVYLSDPQAISPTTTGGGAYTINPADIGTWELTASMPGYKLEEKIKMSVIAGVNNAKNLYLYQVGNIAGQITDTTSGNPVSDIAVKLVNNTGKTLGEAFSTSTGYYLLQDVPVGSGYQVQLDNIDNQGYSIDTPVSGYHANVAVSMGATTGNKNFKISKKYGRITGKVNIDNTDISEGVLILAYPSTVTPHAQDYRSDLTTAPHLQYYTGRSRVYYNSFGLVAQRNANFNLYVPLGTNYDIYAYYSYVSYTGTPAKPIKTLKKYYKSITSIPPDSTNQNITGALSGWTAY